MEQISDNTAAVASIEDVAACTARADAQVKKVLGGVMAQRRSAAGALDYVAALRAELAGLAAAWIPGADGDLIGPGIAIDETAQLEHGDATACVAPRHAGCTGQVENCVTTVFSAYVTARGQAWADFDVYVPDRWASDPPRRSAAGIPGDLEFATKPQLATNQLGRLIAAGLPAKWVASGRGGRPRRGTAHEGCQGEVACVAIIPRDYPVTTAAGATVPGPCLRCSANGTALVRDGLPGPGARLPEHDDF